MPQDHPHDDDESLADAVAETAGEQLGVEAWDRPAIFRETATAAAENGLPYWLVLSLSGGIATLGLALDSAAVVIGAMLVAPLLAPVVGLALSLATGDGKLAVQTGAVVVASTAAVALTAALLALLLPFHTITLQISARIRPSTLDLAVAVFSGLVGAVVTVGRRSRLSAAIPGVAISVALIPPLAVAGFGLGIGRWDLVRGSMLLYGANLAGIVLSGMIVFLLVGMQRDEVLDAARRFHADREEHGLAGWAGRRRWVRRVGVFRSVWARVGMVAAFTVALGIPLAESLSQIAREARVEGAVTETARELFDVPGRSSILDRQVVFGAGRTQVYLRVATTGWYGAEARERFERAASAQAGEQVRLSLEQLPARGEDLEGLADLLPTREPRPVRPPPPPAPAGIPALLSSARARLDQALEVVSLPAGTRVVGMELGVPQDGEPVLRVTYASPAPLPPAAEEMLRRQLSRAVELAADEVLLSHLSTAARALEVPGPDTLVLAPVADALRRHPVLRARVTAPDSAAARGAAAWLAGRGIDPARVGVTVAPGAPEPTVRLAPEPDG